ncbi:MAG: alpha/beta hydrolase [Halofilum sp. (in: g-proteobacteria)]|nr:alpha/beta hydrolase [Halofilum sp. (in: g-proteobacteria)]
MNRAVGGALLVLLALLGGCASPGAVLAPPDYQPARRPPPRLDPDGILLLYAHGSRQEFRRDRCIPGSVTTPRWLRGFVGMRIGGLPVSVYALCTPSRVGDYRHTERSGRPKVEQRAADLEAAVARFRGLGFAPGRVFLLGHSAGGWAALWAARDGDPPVAGVIAFAPAFAGPASGRSPGWQSLRERHARELQRSAFLPALVFAYRGDAFEDPAALSFLQAVPGVELVTLDPRPCGDTSPHRAVFSPCVMDVTVRARIRGFVERRLSTTRAADALP